MVLNRGIKKYCYHLEGANNIPVEWHLLAVTTLRRTSCSDLYYDPSVYFLGQYNFGPSCFVIFRANSKIDLVCIKQEIHDICRIKNEFLFVGYYSFLKIQNGKIKSLNSISIFILSFPLFEPWFFKFWKHQDLEAPFFFGCICALVVSTGSK